MAKRSAQPSFDFDAEPAEWHEVPAALYLSWSEGMQRSYCAARDRDSAKQADSIEWTAFYEQRAASYEGA